MQLTVENLAVEDTWKDIVRIPKAYRKDVKGNHVARGRICRITVGKKSKLVIVRGWKSTAAAIKIDLTLRLALDVKEKRSYEFQLKPVSWLGYLRFTWTASDPIYRVPAQLSLVSFILGSVLGMLGLILGLMSLLQDKTH